MFFRLFKGLGGGGGGSDRVLSRGYLQRTMLFNDAMLRFISRAYDVVYHSNYPKAACTCMSGPAKACS